MIIAPHWDMREYMHELTADDDNPRAHKGARLPVLLQFMLYANSRLRCWPATQTICQNTGLNERAIVEARRWLLAHKAMILVPYAKRQGKEKELPHRQQIYQLTGVLELGDRTVPYILMSPEMFETVLEELEAIEGEVGYTKVSVLKVFNSPTSKPQGKNSRRNIGKTKTSNTKVSDSPTEGIPVLEGISIDQGIEEKREDSPAAPSKELSEQPAQQQPQPPIPPHPLPRYTLPVYGGQDTFADGKFIDVGKPDFIDSCNAIFRAWLDTLNELERKPDTAPRELWEKNQIAIKALAINRRTPEQIARFIRFAYSDKYPDDFYRNMMSPITLHAIGGAIAGWLSKSSKPVKTSAAPEVPPPIIRTPEQLAALHAAQKESA